MPYYTFREIPTPLKLFGLRLYREMGSGILYIKRGKKTRRPLFAKDREEKEKS